jgi:hypothetical protein
MDGRKKGSRHIQFCTIGKYLVSREKHKNACRKGSFSKWGAKAVPHTLNHYKADPAILVNDERDIYMNSTYHICHWLTALPLVIPQQPGKYL